MNDKYIKVNEYAKLMKVHRNTVIRWAKQGKIETIRPDRIILIKNPHYTETEPQTQNKWIGYARVSSHDQKTSLINQENTILKYANKNNILLDSIKTEIGSGFNEKRKTLNTILETPHTNIIIEHRDRLSRSNFKLIESSLKAQNRQIIVIDDKEIENDLVQELSEFLMSKCASIYGKRDARKKAEQTAKEVKDNVANNE